MSHVVYALFDPGTRLVRYVGATKQAPAKRLAGHVQDARSGSGSARAAWIRSLLDTGTLPICAVLEDCHDEVARQAAERKWFLHFLSLGHDLVNSPCGVGTAPKKTPGRGVIGPASRVDVYFSDEEKRDILAAAQAEHTGFGRVSASRWVRRAVLETMRLEGLEF